MVFDIIAKNIIQRKLSSVLVLLKTVSMETLTPKVTLS